MFNKINRFKSIVLIIFGIIGIIVILMFIDQYFYFTFYTPEDAMKFTGNQSCKVIYGTNSCYIISENNDGSYTSNILAKTKDRYKFSSIDKVLFEDLLSNKNGSMHCKILQIKGSLDIYVLVFGLSDKNIDDISDSRNSKFYGIEEGRYYIAGAFIGDSYNDYQIFFDNMVFTCK